MQIGLISCTCFLDKLISITAYLVVHDYAKNSIKFFLKNAIIMHDEPIIHWHIDLYPWAPTCIIESILLIISLTLGSEVRLNANKQIIAT